MGRVTSGFLAHLFFSSNASTYVLTHPAVLKGSLWQKTRTGKPRPSSSSVRMEVEVRLVKYLPISLEEWSTKRVRQRANTDRRRKARWRLMAPPPLPVVLLMLKS